MVMSSQKNDKLVTDTHSLQRKTGKYLKLQKSLLLQPLVIKEVFLFHNCVNC